MGSYAMNSTISLTWFSGWGATPASSVGAGSASSKLVSPTVTVLLFEVANQINATPSGSSGILLPPQSGNDGSLAGNGMASTPYPMGGNIQGLGAGCGQRGGFYATGTTYGQSQVFNAGEFLTGYTGRHTDAANWLFADGHVKWLKAGNVSPGTSAVNSTDTDTPGDTYTRAAGTAGTLYSGGPSVVATFSAT